MENIRNTYKVPAKRGMEIKYKGQPGTITGSQGSHLLIKLEGETFSKPYHPTWEIEYPPFN